MLPADFITKNIIAILASEGVSDEVARGGATAALDYYRRSSQASRKGRMFDDLLHEARQWVRFHASKTVSRKRKERKGSLL